MNPNLLDSSSAMDQWHWGISPEPRSWPGFDATGMCYDTSSAQTASGRGPPGGHLVHHRAGVHRPYRCPASSWSARGHRAVRGDGGAAPGRPDRPAAGPSRTRPGATAGAGSSPRPTAVNPDQPSQERHVRISQSNSSSGTAGHGPAAQHARVGRFARGNRRGGLAEEFLRLRVKASTFIRAR
jgi:hypothetical protein